MNPRFPLTLQYSTTTCCGSALSHVSMALQIEHSLSKGGACSSGQPKSWTWGWWGGGHRGATEGGAHKPEEGWVGMEKGPGGGVGRGQSQETLGCPQQAQHFPHGHNGVDTRCTMLGSISSKKSSGEVPTDIINKEEAGAG